MKVFAIIAPGQPEKLRARIEAAYDEKHRYELSEGGWFIAGGGTAKEAAAALGITEGDARGGIVIPVTSYYGWYNRDFWEWLSARLEEE